MLFAANKTVLVHANVYLIIMAIHTKAVGQSVLSVPIVRRTKPVLETNVKILVQDFVLKMLNAELSTMCRLVLALSVIQETHTVIVL